MTMIPDDYQPPDLELFVLTLRTVAEVCATGAPYHEVRIAQPGRIATRLVDADSWMPTDPHLIEYAHTIVGR